MDVPVMTSIPTKFHFTGKSEFTAHHDLFSCRQHELFRSGIALFEVDGKEDKANAQNYAENLCT